MYYKKYLLHYKIFYLNKIFLHYIYQLIKIKLYKKEIIYFSK